MRRSIVLALAGLAVTAVAACGSGSSSSGSGASASAPTGGGGGDYCGLAKKVKDGTGGLDGVFASNNATFIKQQLVALSAEFHAAAAAAPSDIASDWALEDQAFTAINNAVAGSSDMTAIGSAVHSVEVASSSLSSAADAASTRIDAYTQTHCGFTIGSTSSSQSQSSSTTASS